MSFNQLATTKKDLKTILREVDFPIIHIADNGIKGMNQAAEKLLQFDAFNDCMRDFSDFCKAYRYCLDQLLDDNERCSKTLEESYTRGNKTYIILWRIAKFPETKKSKHTNEYLLFGCDISKEKLAIEELKRTKSFYNNILSKLPTNVYWKDENSVYMGCNDRLASSMGLPSREAIKGLTDFDFDWGVPGAAEDFVEFDRKVMSTGRPLTTEDVFKESDGNVVTVLTNKTPLRDEKGKAIGILAISVDITDKKKAEADLIKAKEAAEAASQAKSMFLQNMRHDLRTPLTGIVGFAQAIKSEVNDPAIKEYADNLVSSSEALLNILNEILDSIRLMSGTEFVHKKKFDLEEKLRSVVNLNQSKANEKKLELSLEYDNSVPKYFISDYGRIQRIILELLANALKFTEKGNVKIIVQMEKQDAANPIIKIAVRDTGIGIPDSKRKEIFGIFNRLHDAHQGVFHGIGLGLTITEQFISDLQGEIYVESTEGEGSEFICVLPLQLALVQDDSHVEQLEDSLVLKKTPLSTAGSVTNTPVVSCDSNTAITKILVVEDNDLAAKAASITLKKLGCQVDIAPNGNIGIELAKTNVYGLIFMDVGLPDMNGNEVTRAIRDWENQFERHTPIIGLTAHVEAEDKQICIQSGMDAVLSKPLKPETAEDLLNAFIPKHHGNNETEKPLKTIFAQFGLPEKEEEFFKLPEKYIDFDMLSKVSDDPHQWAKDILPEMADELGEEIEKIKTAHTKGDWQFISDLAHKLKGGTTYCGTVRLEQACFYMEAYIKTELIVQKEALYQQLLKEMANTQQSIRRWMENDSSSN